MFNVGDKVRVPELLAEGEGDGHSVLFREFEGKIGTVVNVDTKGMLVHVPEAHDFIMGDNFIHLYHGEGELVELAQEGI